MRLFEDAQKLIEQESITPNEAGVTDLLETLVQEMGLETRSEVISSSRRNLIAGPEQPKVLFCTHTDTVPPYYPFSEDDGFLYGRGACDTKGISACFLEAGRRLLQQGAKDFGYLWVVGEEVDNVGAIKANESIRADHLIVGEPTENLLALGHKGCLGVRLDVEGKAAHSAYPNQGVSANHILLEAIQKIRNQDFGVDPILGSSSVNIGTIAGGVAANVLAPQAGASVLIRVVTEMEEAEQRVLQALDKLDSETRERVSVDFYLKMHRCFTTEVEGFETTIVSYGTDLPFMPDVGKLYLMGPGSILDAHTAYEKISKAQMIEAVDLYVDLALKLMGED